MERGSSPSGEIHEFQALPAPNPALLQADKVREQKEIQACGPVTV